MNTLVRVYQHRDTYRPEKGSFGAWFNKIAMNEARSQIRLQLKRKEKLLSDDLAVFSDPGAWHHDWDEEVDPVRAPATRRS